MKGVARLFLVFLVFIMLAAAAVISGLSLAIWDTDSTVQEVYAMAFLDEASYIARLDAVGTDPEEKEVIEIKDSDIKEYKDAVQISSGDINKPITEELSDGIGTIKYADSGKNVRDFASDGEIGSLVNANDEQQKQDEESSEEQTDQPDISDESQNDKERKPLVITADISNITKVVRAGDEKDSLTNLPVEIPELTKPAVDVDPTVDYPLPFTEVGLSYFDDALFIGDSRVAGLATNSSTNATFYAVPSFQVYKYKTFKVVQTPEGKVPIFDAMPYDRFTKIYIKVGLNELGSVSDEPFLEAYESLINDLRVMQPRAIIYIQAILPVTQVKSMTDRVHCNENIARRNENLKSFAELMKCYYVDVGPYFADETGALREDLAADGIHMYGKYMPEWIDALSKQAVAWPPEE